MMKITFSILLFISTLSGICQATWTLSNSGYDISYAPTDMTNQSNGDIFMAGNKIDINTNGIISKLFKSTNSGSSWTEITTSGLTNLGFIHSLAFSGNTMILSGMDVNTTNGAQIFISNDNGNNWTLSNSGYDISYAPTDMTTQNNGDIFLAGDKYDSTLSGMISKLFKSTNGGSSWTEITTSGLTNLGFIHSLEFSGNTMILSGMDVNATNGAQIFISNDNGNNWTLSNSGYDFSYAPTDMTTQNNGDIFLAGNKYDSTLNGIGSKLFKSTNSGNSWSEITTSGLTNLGMIHSLEISGNTMILSGMDINATNGAKIFTSNFNSTTSVSETEFQNATSIFPNPFTERITIDFPILFDKRPLSIKLISITGKTITQVSISNNTSIQLNTDNLSSGLYVVILEFARATQTFKLMKE